MEPFHASWMPCPPACQKHGSPMWAPLFGMLTDRFGVTWVMDVVADYSTS